MNYGKIQKDFKTMSDDTQKLIDKYNKSVQSIRSQEIAIEKVKQKLESIKTGDIVPPSLRVMEAQLSQIVKRTKKVKNRISELQNQPSTTLVEDKELAKLRQSLPILAKAKQNMYDEIDAARSSCNEVQSLNAQLDLMNDKLQDSKESASGLKDEIEDSMNDNSSNTFGEKLSELGDKVDKFKSRISRLIVSVAVFNTMRNALNSLKNNFVNLLKTDDNFNASLNQIRANLMTAFSPIYNACLPAINALMNSLSKITGTIAVFVANLFGTSLQDATSDAKKLSSALNQTSKSAKKASGNLASWDTLEVIQDNSGDGASGSGSNDMIDYSGEITYSQKLLDFMNKIKDVVVGIWEWGTKNKELVISIAALIATAFAASKIIGFISSFSPLTDLLEKISGLFVKVGEDGSKSFNKVGTGTTVAIAGFALMLKGIVDLVDKWDELDTKQKLIRVGMIALGTAAIALGYAIAAGISAATLGIGSIIAIIATLLTSLAAVTLKFLNEKDAILSTKDAQEKLTEAHENYVKANENYVSAVDRADAALKELEEAEKRTGLSGEELYKSVQNGTLDYANMTAEQKEVYKAYLNNQTSQEQLTEATNTLSDAKKAEIDASFKNQLAIAAETGNYDEYKKSVIAAYEDGTLSAEEARDKIEQAMSRMSDANQKTFMEDIPGDVKEGMNPDRYQTTWQKFKNWWGSGISKLGEMFSTFFTKTIPEGLAKLGNDIKTFFTKTVPNVILGALESLMNSFIAGFEGLINKPIKAINKIIKTANKIPGVNIGTFTEANLGRVKLPRLADGTVIPPRQEFAAILGDQKHGTNIEAPLETIKQANREVMKEFLDSLFSLNSNEREIIFKNLTFVLQFGKKSFDKLVLESLRLSEKELGKQLLVS